MCSMDKCLNFPKQATCRAFQCLWNELSIVISFESDWKRAKGLVDWMVRKHAGILSKAALKKLIEASKKSMTFFNILIPFVYDSIKKWGFTNDLLLCQPTETESN